MRREDEDPPVVSGRDGSSPTPYTLHPTPPAVPGPSTLAFSEKPRLLVVEDDEDLATQMKWALAQDYEVFLASERAAAITALKEHETSVVTLDLGLPPAPGGVEEGFRTLVEILEAEPSAKVIIITGRDEREHALRAVAQGAYDFFSKPIRIEELAVVLRRAFHLYHLEQENRMLRQAGGAEAFEGMLGTSPRMQEVFTKIRKVATTDAPVLLMGESGTGKELAARAIHRLGYRSRGPFVPINCGAIPENLLESELFGHEKGAFTGAHIQRKGRIEMAQGGTLFLDEVGELSPMLQVKLLRYLQEQRIERVGGREEIIIDARVMAATNMDLQAAMEDGRFRQDLYYRLGVVVIGLPPLRDRQGDVPLLARVLLDRFAVESRKKVRGFASQAMRAMENYGWPGNVRELENRIRRAVIMTEGGRITPEDLEFVSAAPRREGMTLREAREAAEKEMILQAMARTRGHLSQAAADLGISRPTLYELMQKLGIGKT
jgi:two-component system, NtrC family, response regulator